MVPCQVPSPHMLTCINIFHHFASPAVSSGCSIPTHSPFLSFCPQRGFPTYMAPRLSNVLLPYLRQSTWPSAAGGRDAQGAHTRDAPLVLSVLGPARGQSECQSNQLSMQAGSMLPIPWDAQPGRASPPSTAQWGSQSHAKDGSCFSSNPPRV